MSVNGTVGVPLTPAEQALVLRAVRELVEREGETDTAVDVIEMLEQALPVGAMDVFAEALF